MDAKACTELYYAMLEGQRATAEDEYFNARPQLMRTLAEQALFRAGFDRAFAYLWPLLAPEHHAQETSPAPEASFVETFRRSPRRVAEPDCIKCADGKTDSHGLPLTAFRMFVCPECGNKRCPKASDHELACTGSNEPGQPGSIYAL